MAMPGSWSSEPCSCRFVFVFFNDTETTEIYTLSLDDALPISSGSHKMPPKASASTASRKTSSGTRSEEHTSELQSACNLVCRLLLENKKNPWEHSFALLVQAAGRGFSVLSWGA